MKLKRKLLTALAAFSMMVPLALGVGGLGAGAEEAAAKDTVDFTLHKKKFTSDQTVTKNTGSRMNEFDGVAGLNGIRFDAYDVSAEYYALLKEEYGSTGKKYTPAQAVKELQDNYDTSEDSTLTGKTATVTLDGTAVDGVVQFKNLPSKVTISGKSQYAVYLFSEKLTAAQQETMGATGNAANLVVVLPIMNTVVDEETEEESKVELTDIHLYPKNKITERSFYLKKVATDKKDFEIAGSKFTIQNSENKYYAGMDAKTEMPIFQATPFYVEGNSTIKGLRTGTYTVKETTKGTGTEFTEEALSFDIVIADDGTVTKKVVEDGDENGAPAAELDVTHTAVEGTVTVENRRLSSFTFTKVNAATGDELPGAVFHVTKGKDENRLYKWNGTTELPEGQYEYIWEDELTTANKDNYDVVIFDGVATGELTGLKVGTYYLWEKTAPNGFVQPTGDAAYTQIDLFEGTGDNKVVKPGNGKVENIEEGILPSTGGAGIIAFLAIGAALMAGAFVWYKSSKKETTEV